MMLVTGAFGFIGSHLIESLLTSGSKVLAVGHPTLGENSLEELLVGHREGRIVLVMMDLRSPEQVIQLIAHYSPEKVFHLAALSSHRLSVLQPHTFLENNITTLLNVLEAARRCEPSPKVVFTSSSSVYGDQKPPLSEDLPPRPKGPYALSKWIGEELVKGYVADYGLDATIVRYFNVVGERCKSNIVFKVFADRISSGQPVEVNGRTVDGVFRPATRDFIYVGDAVAMTVLVSYRGRRGEIYNVGRGEPVSVEALAYEMMKVIGRRVEVVRRELAPHESLESYSDNSKVMRELGWSPNIALQTMVRRYVEWYLPRRGTTRST
ncbi:MAG: GDP-mannose 4,6-dehydratase [Thaumarchaeota archaeon]|nr:GDP-mannose 4,6-dehydratase [Candidatus Calditenuaceae archaeon]MDW8186963.1 GDP-mannose 4,6-dehydratase [Nitrososphaerota archaeon]